MGADGPEEGADEQRLSPGVSAVVEAVNGEATAMQGHHHDGRGHGPDRRRDGQRPDPPSSDHEQGHEGPDQVVLLLDG